MDWFKLQEEAFPGQQKNEEIYLETRQHWIVLMMRFVSWALFAGILILLDWSISTYVPVLHQSPYVEYVNLFKSVYLMFLCLGLLILWTMYYLNIQIITNERIVDINQKSLLHHSTTELHLSRIEDVTAEVKGVFGNLFDYGNVYIQTAGETQRFVFDHVPNPAGIEKLILDLYEQLPEEQKESKRPLRK